VYFTAVSPAMVLCDEVWHAVLLEVLT